MDERLAAREAIGHHVQERADEQAADGGEDDGQGHGGAGRSASGGDYQLPPVLQPPWPAVVQLRVGGAPRDLAMVNTLVDFDVAATL